MNQLTTTSTVRQEIINPMLARWKAPPHLKSREQIDMVLRDYETDLAGYDIPTLAAAFTTVRRAHKFQTWPAIADFLNECRGMGRTEAPDENDDASRAQASKEWYRNRARARAAKGEFIKMRTVAGKT
jgi:hypothetical protein